MALIPKLRGMFAFVIADLHRKTLFVCRDRVGKKPLFYFRDDDHFIFASEIKSLLHHPVIKNHLNIRKKSIHEFLQIGYIQEPATIYEEIYKFPAGCYATIRENFKVEPIQYWYLPDYVASKRVNSEERAIGQLDNLLHEAVQLRMVADVPIGTFLSGGIDSSLVTVIASQHAKMKSFSIGFENSKYNESNFGEAVAKKIDTEHTSFILKEHEVVSMIDVFFDHIDEPFADSSFLPTMLVSKLARQEVTVALTGDGGDELFLGYGAYRWANRLANPLIKLNRGILKNVLANSPSARFKRVSSMFTAQPQNENRYHIFSQEQYFFTDIEIKNKLLITANEFNRLSFQDPKHFYKVSEAEKQALFDFEHYLKDDLLVKVDRASMYWGLECRSPLLDSKLAEFAVNLPYHLKIRGNENKYILKKILFNYLPKQLFNRPKWGFSIPLETWLKSDLSYLMEYLSEEKINKTKLFNYSYIQELIKRFYKGENYLYSRLWLIIILQKFLLNHEQ
jgi:asparagine synthase (glutamine-hydrolysing)